MNQWSADRMYMSDESWSEEGEAAAERREGSRKDGGVVFGHKEQSFFLAWSVSLLYPVMSYPTTLRFSFSSLESLNTQLRTFIPQSSSVQATSTFTGKFRDQTHHSQRKKKLPTPFVSLPLDSPLPITILHL